MRSHIAEYTPGLRDLASALGMAVLLAAVGCTTVTPKQRAEYDQQSARLVTEEVSVVSDGCVIRDEVGDDDYLLRLASQDVGHKVANSASDYLKQRGIAVSTVMTPFICGIASQRSEDLADSESKG